MNQFVCKSCGSNSFGKGIMDGYTNVRPEGKFFSGGTSLELIICTECGDVASMRVKKPHKFKQEM
ncbi:hypothetical protein [Lederbergia graminis]|uniref:Transcription initiation factor TFIIIB n=1 Tax=Lederbergia graminis TaxID=735518 RepID=A0ABW0LG52_9BACI